MRAPHQIYSNNQGSLRVPEKNKPHDTTCRGHASHSQQLRANLGLKQTLRDSRHAERGHIMLQCHCGASRTHSTRVHPQADELGRRVSTGNHLCPPGLAGTLVLLAILDAAQSRM